MNWGKILIGGIVAGVAMNIVDFVLHGIVMSKTGAVLGLIIQRR